MVDLVLPPDLAPAKVTWQLVDYTGASSSPFSGTLRTVGRGQRWSATYSFKNLSGAKRARLVALLAALEGKNNRIWLTDPSYQQIGSFPGGEIYTNPQFTNGTTGWAAQNATLSSQSGRLRITNTKGGGAANFAASQAPALTAGLPYVLRSILSSPKSMSSGIYGSEFSPANVYAAGYGGLFTNTGVVNSSGAWTNYAAVFDSVGTAALAGDYGEILYTTLQQCAHVDNAPNLLQQSNAFATAPWSLSNSPAGLTNVADPQGGATAVQLLENATNGAHATEQAVTVPAAAAPLVISVSVQAGTRSWVYLQLFETTGNTVASVWFNASTGVFGTTQLGANWANARTYVVNRGGGWYRISFVAKKTNAATTVQGWIAASTGDTVTIYAGVASAIALNLWHASLAQSGVPVGDTLTTAAASSGTTQAGTILNVRGLPLSTNQLLAAGDRFEVNGEHKIATSDLNSDGAGMGVVQLEPALRTAHPDGDPILMGTPLGRFAMLSDAKWTTVPAFFSDSDVQFIEA